MKTIKDMSKIEKKKPSIVKCSVCQRLSINEIGSSCCGGIWEYLYIEEVEALGFDPVQTRNDQPQPQT